MFRCDEFDQRLEYLNVVAAVDDVGVEAVDSGNVEPRIVRKLGLAIRRAEIGPDQAAGFAHGISLRLDPMLEVGIVDVWGLHDGSVDAKLPSVKETADAVAFASTDDKRGLPMAAMFVENSDQAVRIAERDKIVAHDAKRKWIAVRLGQIRRLQYRNPVPAQGLAHWRIGADTTH